MDDIALRVESLSKRYRIGARWNETLSDLIELGMRRLFHLNGQPNDREPKCNEFWALKDVSFGVKHGEVLGVIGCNGAGKSTLLKILSRITQPTEGRAEIHGRVGSLLEVGTGFHPELSGRENIYLSGAILGMKKFEIDRKFDEIVAFSEIERFLDTPVKRYSSGMYVRLAFAVAAHLEQEILLVDEVLAVGDIAFQKKCIGKIDQVSKGGRTIIFVSHSLPAVANLCTRVILMHRGTVSEDGAPQHVIDKYLKQAFVLSATPLAGRKDREGLGEIFVSNVEFLDHNQQPIGYPVSGQELRIRVHYKSIVNKLFRNCLVFVAINRGDRVYILLSTNLVDKNQPDLRGDGYIDFVLPELPLFGGDYYLDVAIQSDAEDQDWVLGAAEMSVVDGDFYGTGKIYPHEGWQGLGMPVKHRWELGDSR